MIKNITLVLLLCFAQNIAIADDKPYFNQKAHFYLQIPDGWAEIPNQEIKDFEVSMGVKDKYLTGFYTKHVTSKTYPYILIENKDIGRKITAKEIQKARINFDSYIKKNNYSSLNNSDIMKKLKAEYGIKEMKYFNEAVYDAKKNIISLNLIVTTSLDGNIIGKMFLVFYRDGFLQVICYAKEAEYAQFSPLFEKFISSLSFENTYQYSVTNEL